MGFTKVDKIILFAVAMFATSIIVVSLAFADTTPRDLQVRIDRTVQILIRDNIDEDKKYFGSGLLLDSGKVLTAGHLFTGGTAGAGKTPGGDIFLLQRTPTKLFVKGEIDATLATGKQTYGNISVRCSRPQMGEAITVVGYPAQIGPLVLRGTIASSKISELGGKYIAVGLEVAEGISGAPVFDSDGRLLGILVGLLPFEVGGLASIVATADIAGVCGE